MAITVRHIADCRVGILKVAGIAQQAAWGTASGDSSDALELNMRSAVLDEDVQHREHSAALTGTRNDDTMNHQNDLKGACPTFEITTPGGVLKQELAYFLHAHLQAVTQGVSTPYNKTFTFSTAGNPDFTADDGYFASMIFRVPDSSLSFKVKDIVGLERLAFSCTPGGFLELTQTMRGRGAITTTANPTGTWARATATGVHRFHFNDMHVTMDFGSGAQALDLLGEISWETTRELVRIGTDSGDILTFATGANKGTFKMRMLFDADARSFEQCARAGTDIDVNIYWGTGAGSTDGDLEFTFMLHPTKAQRVEGDSGIFAVDVEGIIIGDKSVPTEMYQVDLADAQDMGW